MKRIPLADLRPPPGARPLLTPEKAEERMRRDLRAMLAGTAKAELARQLMVSDFQLTLALRDRGIGPELAERLGYRKVIRFEKVE